MKKSLAAVLILFCALTVAGQSTVEIWHKHEMAFESSRIYDNPVYDVEEFYAVFTASSGKEIKINGFWDGGKDWKIRFMPVEMGEWKYRTFCSDKNNAGLHNQSGIFSVVSNTNEPDIYSKGPLARTRGTWYLTHADGTPFFWVGCTAWNGALKSTDEEWDKYLKHRSEHDYNVIQLVTTQWRGCDMNSEGEVAFKGSGRITINPGFFRRMDKKIDEVNSHGLVAAPVLLWALPFGEGMHLSPGYYLPDKEAILLARYIVARYGGNHVVWILGGDGKYYGELESRWKFIGKEVFRDNPPGLATLHPHGRSWIGDIYADEHWFDIAGYQSTHGTTERHVNFITLEVGSGWKDIPPMPVINLEPCYEQIRNEIFDDDVRQASYWSVFAAPPSGITYGHDGTWPWLREGEKPLNHRYTPEVDTWDKGIELPGSMQIAYLGNFMRSFDWWDLYPAQELLLEQPGNKVYNHHISVLKLVNNNLILVYTPVKNTIKLLLPSDDYVGKWFDPVNNSFIKTELETVGNQLTITSPGEKDMVLVLERR